MNYEITNVADSRFPRRNRQGPAPRYPWAEMNVGDVFVICAGNVKFSAFRSNLRTRNRTHAEKFKCSELPNGNIQVWRDA